MTTGAARVSDSHCQLSNWRAGTIESSTTGTLSTALTSSRSRSGSGSAAGAAAGSAAVSGAAGGGGSSAV